MNTSHAIICEDLPSFYDAIHALIKRGLTFKAIESELTIYLTGGF
tara:strand:- start:2189 stop:2323 length:135 start_codon:yes stop_codon:yes gene_type:complete